MVTNAQLLQAIGWAWIFWCAYWAIAAIFVKRTKAIESVPSRLMHTVPILAGAYLIVRGARAKFIDNPPHAATAFDFTATILTFAGLLFCVWARVYLGTNWSGRVTLKEDHKLIRGGPYGFVRHPIYTGLLAAVLGEALLIDSLQPYLGVILFAIAFIGKLRREEAMLTREFGEEYLQFKKEVPALVPFIQTARINKKNDSDKLPGGSN